MIVCTYLHHIPDSTCKDDWVCTSTACRTHTTISTAWTHSILTTAKTTPTLTTSCTHPTSWLSQQWREALNLRHDIRTISLDMSQACDAVWHTTFISKSLLVASNGPCHHGSLTSCTAVVSVWLSTGSSHLLSLSRWECPMAGSFAQSCSSSSSMIELWFPRDIANPFSDDSTLCRVISYPWDRQAAAASLSADLERIRNWSNTWNLSFNQQQIRHTHPLSPKGPSGKVSPWLPEQTT